MEHLSAIPPRTYWRPWPIKTPYLLLFTCLCIFIAIILQVIKYACNETGCSTFGSYDVTEVPNGVQFVYNFLPVVLSVAFELLWTLSHHEIIRLEPYFQLSADGGATEQDSLTLAYSYMFPLLLPVKAFKRRHWVVGLSSCVLLIITLIVAPLTSGIFDESILQRTVISQGSRTAAQLGWSKRFTPDFSYPLFKHIVEGIDAPKFTTDEYALQPIKVTEQLTHNETITAKTVLYKAELSCKPAEVLDTWWTNDYGFGVLFFSREGNVNIKYCDEDKIKRPADSEIREGTFRNGTRYICDDFISVATAEWASASFVWQVNSSQKVDGSSFHVWAGPIETRLASNGTERLPKNITGIFCTPSYHTQEVEATFSESGNVTDVKSIGPRRPFEDAQGFEHIVNGSYFKVPTQTKGYLDSQGKAVGFGMPPVKIMNPQERAFRKLCPKVPNVDTHKNTCVSFRSYTLPSYAFLQLTSEDLKRLLDPVFAAKAYDRMFRAMFAFAMSDNLATYEDPSKVEAVELKRAILTRGYRTNETWVRIAQAMLILVAALVFLLLKINYSRPCELDGEPNSLSEMLHLLAASEPLCQHLENVDNDIGRQLVNKTSSNQRRFHLRLVRDRGPMIEITVAENIPKSEMALGTPKPLSTGHSEPWSLQKRFAIPVIVMFIIVALLLIAAFGAARTHNGLPTFSGTSSAAYKFAYSYIPFIVGSSIGPTLASVAEIHCMLGPYELLQRRPQSSQRALALDFDRSPPEFQVLSAIHSKHFALAALATTIPLSHVLAIALATLFSPYSAELSVPVGFQMAGLNYNSPTTPREVAFALDQNITTSVDGPTWTTGDYYVKPFHPLNSHGTLLQYQGPTQAIGLDIECQVVPVKIDTGNFTGTIEERANLTAEAASKMDFAVVIGNSRYLKAHHWWVNLEKPASDWAYLKVTGDNQVYIDAVWLELPGNPNPAGAPPYRLERFTGVGLSCNASVLVWNLIATVNARQQLLSTSSIQPVSAHDQQMINKTMFAGTIAQSLDKTLAAALQVRPSTCPWLCQVSSLMARSHPEIVQHPPTNVTHIPDTNGLPSAFESVIRSFWAVSLRLYMEESSEVTFSPEDGLGMMTVLDERVQISVPFFGLAAAILVYIIAVLVVLLWKKPNIITPLPLTLATAYSLLHSSTAKEDCQEGKSPRERAKHFVGEYGLGKFQAADGRWFNGVYRKQ
ncbi:hypothetical protein BDZ91DRAFT_793795 [Kalaharituber pfeilii]|nr:hypothetical protein BDZ91DRAFT_793795 [Kalaharituber pfeilii]